MIVAGIGSRETPPDILALMETLGGEIVRRGHRLHSGNAVGADQAFQRGANAVAPERVHVFLPWAGYNREHGTIHTENVVHVCPKWSTDESVRRMWVLAEKYHGNWPALGQGARKMMVRNIQIVLPSSLVICYQNPGKSWGGGTGHGVRCARDRSIKVIDLATEEGMRRVQDLSL